MDHNEQSSNQQPQPMEQYDCFEVKPDSCGINGQVIDADQYDRIYRWIEGELLIVQNCPYCSTQLLCANSEMQEDKFYAEVSQISQLWSCSNCAYWHWYNREMFDYIEDDGDTTETLYSTACISKMRDFELTLPEGCEAEIALAIRRNEKMWHTIDPYRFERFVGSIFKANFSHCDVMHVGKSDDGGVDLIFVDSQQDQWLIQVKRRESSTYSEGVNTVRNLLGALFLNDCLRGILVSTADHFTFRAYQAVGRANELGRIVKLIDRGKLRRMLNPLLPDRPWRNAISEQLLDLDPTRDFEAQIPARISNETLF